jgi:peptide/nickel transport system substrate-binding protein
MHRLLAVLMGAALFAAACGGGDEGGGNAPSTSSNEQQRGTEASKVFGGTNPEPGGVFKFASVEGPDYMDPGAAYTVTFFAFVNPGILRELVAYKHSPNFEESNTVAPDLATDLGQHNPEGTEWTYTLKDGIKFGPALGGEDVPGVTGEEITSADIKYAIERQFIGSVGAQYPFYYEAIEGVKEFQSGAADDISGIETPDDKTITFKLSEPVGDWDYRMAMPAAAPVPERYAKQFDSKKNSAYDNHIVASGPYYVDSFTPSEEAHYLRNEHWDPETDDLREAYVDEVQWKMGFEEAVCVDKVLSNDYDTAVDCTPEGGQLKEIVQDEELNQRFFNYPEACTSYIFMNTTVEPFDDPKVRQAVNYAIDRENQLKVLGGVFTGDVATSILPPGMIGHLPTSEFDPFATPNSAGDPAKAKEMLKGTKAEGGWHDKLLLVGDASGAGPKQIESVRADLEAIGFDNLEIKQLNYPDYYTQYYGEPATNTAMGFSAWCEDWPSPVTFLEPLLYGPNILKHGNSNYAEIDDPGLNSVIEKASATPIDEADDEWTEANRMATEMAPWIPIRWYLGRIVASENVVNGYFHQYFENLDWVNAGIKH